MTHHSGTLPPYYIEKLEGMDLQEIAAEAALMRSDGGRCGTATAKILAWVRGRLDAETFKDFMKEYVQAWVAERQARAEGKSSRPIRRPVKGGRLRPRSADVRPGSLVSYR